MRKQNPPNTGTFIVVISTIALLLLSSSISTSSLVFASNHTGDGVNNAFAQQDANGNFTIPQNTLELFPNTTQQGQ